MKKVLAFTLVLLMLASVLVVPSFAATSGMYGNSIGPSTPGATKATFMTEAAYKVAAEVASTYDKANSVTVGDETKYYHYTALGENLASSLTASDEISPSYSKQADALGDDLVGGTYSLTSDQKKDIADIKYGVSVIGVSHLKRKANTASDGKWTKGDYAFEGRWDTNFYDVTGTTKTSTVNNATGNVYTTLLTYNFGTVKTLDYIILPAPDNDGFANFALQAADIYISNDGENWTLASYWDFAGDRLAGKYGSQSNFQSKYWTPNTVHSYLLGKDLANGSTGNETDKPRARGFILDVNSLQAKYVRIAINGAGGVSYASTYTDRSQHMADLTSSMLAFREILLVGGDAKTTTPATLTGANYLGRQTSAVDNGTFATRYIATIDSLDYAKAGFSVKIHYFNAEGTLTAGNKKDIYVERAYKKLLQYGADPLEATGNDYFIAFSISGLSTTDQNSFVIEVTPFTEDANGVKSYGDTCRETFIAGVHYASVMLPQ